MTIDEMIAILQAAKEGKQIECRPRDSRSSSWVSAYPLWAFDLSDYRVKSEPREWWLQPAPTCDGYYVLTDPNKPKAYAFGSDKNFIKVREVL